ncbi:MAG: hypothetical protein HKN32_07185, partial [Flavobacteriales bacterium]|nr:hypothetical protein [Flavobacteriales bacterium]
MRTLKNLLFSLCLLGSLTGSAQCDTIATICEHNMPSEYISDGQNYWALLYNDQVAEFDLTLF